MNCGTLPTLCDPSPIPPMNIPVRGTGRSRAVPVCVLQSLYRNTRPLGLLQIGFTTIGDRHATGNVVFSFVEH